ncbi:Ldh family oxidoreductase [Pseudomonas japonica]|uniref:Ldh family oxidoreductase n=1 Tax=Pseudomonas japonica TaxID=256466 RepID=UPI0015E344D1|nr:Ldh family oxidoreductase [Pseudomonas japonica]MBA1290480.1 Ldh family oxidoreductase [Pseudomonas japonica]
MSSNSADTVSRETITYPELVALLQQVFRAHGASPSVAAVLAANCAAAQRDGAESHGVFRMAGYLSTIASGWVNPAAEPQVEDVAAGYVAVDAGNGFAQPALAAARPLLIAKARHAGIAVLAIRNSHHFAALWPDVEPFAEEGLIALSVVNSMTCVVPHGGKRPVFGTNPIAFAAPCAGRGPLVFDMATSALAHGDVQIAAREGHTLPEGAGVDAQGAATTDPRAVLDGGALLPFGGHKGSALSMMVELLAAGLTGGNFSFEFDWSRHPGAQTPWTGQLLIVIDPAKSEGGQFAERARVLVERMSDAGVSRLAGERRYQNRKRSLEEGIPLAPERLAALRGWAAGA